MPPATSDAGYSDAILRPMFRFVATVLILGFTRKDLGCTRLLIREAKTEISAEAPAKTKGKP